MKRKLSVIVLSICALFVAAFALGACGQKKEEKSVIGDISQDDIAMTVKATADSIVLDIESDEKAGNGVCDVIEARAYEYVSSDTIYGLSDSKIAVSDDNRAGTYKLGTKSTITLPRYIKADGGDVDRLYNKYYVVSGKRLLKGPIYASEIAAERDPEPVLDIKSKKGLLGENADHYADLGCSYVTLNFDIENMIYPNEMFDDDGIIELAHPDDAIEFTSGGKKYYFNRAKIAAFDSMVTSYYSQGSHVTAIVYASNKGANPEIFPSELTYLPWSAMADNNANPLLLGLNTSNEYGYGYFVAVMEFLAERYTADGLEHGYVANYIIGNEINYPQEYNRISKYQAPLDVYMEEYSRLLRLANLAVKKYDASIAVNVPFTQSWTYKSSLPDTSIHSYAPKTMIEWLNTKTKLEGDFDWGIAPHCYTYGLALPEVFLNDTTNGVKKGMTASADTSTYLTFSNLEIIDEYLNRDELLYDGKARGVWLTEAGVSTYKDDDDRRCIQAGAIAAVWYKISQLDIVKSFSYYRLYDHAAEIGGGARFGLIDADGNKKPAYELYKYIDTQYSQYVAKDYLSYLTYKSPDGELCTVDNGKIKSYTDLLDVFGTGWLDGKEFDWELAMPVETEPVYEWDDEIDLSGVVFESANYLYDGTQKRIEVKNLPDGVDVTYSVPPVLTEVGSIDVVATFTQDGRFVGHRKATLTVGWLATDKTVYNLGESIFVTANIAKPELQSTAWVGIYRKGATPGNTAGGELSYYYYYPNRYGDEYMRTVRLQDYKNPDSTAETLSAGEYVIYYFIDGGYNYFDKVRITVLESGAQSGTVDLGAVSFTDAEFDFDGTEKRLEITGELPDGVTVRYIDNALTDAGSTQAVAVFEKDGEELCRRYAVLTVAGNGAAPVSTDKTEYVFGETVRVTAYAPSASLPKTWWVGLYLDGEDDYGTITSIYYYYVKDDNHVSGGTYDIKQQIANASRAEYADLPVGKYKLVLFNTSGYTVETECAFEVVALDTSGESGSVSTDKTEYSVGEAIKVTADKKADSALTYTVGILRASSSLKLSNVIYSYVIDGESYILGETYDITKATLNPDMAASAALICGEYAIVLFVSDANGGQAVLSSVQIQITGEQPQLTTNKTTYTVGETIYVTAYAPEDGTKWWVGLYLASEDDYSATASIYWYYVNEKGSGRPFDIRKGDKGGHTAYEGIPAGEYKVVLFNTSGYTEETHVVITVTDTAA